MKTLLQVLVLTALATSPPVFADGFAFLFGTPDIGCQSWETIYENQEPEGFPFEVRQGPSGWFGADIVAGWAALGPPNSCNKRQSLDLDFDNSIVRDFDTVPGQHYEIRVVYSHNPGATSSSANLWVGSESPSVPLSGHAAFLTHDVPILDYSLDMEWREYYGRFVAAGTSGWFSLQGTKTTYPEGVAGFAVTSVSVLPVDCDDADGDGYGSPAVATCAGGLTPDCDDSSPAVYPNAVEINDGIDNQCPGDVGAGLVDETSSDPGFRALEDKATWSWPTQQNATGYDVIRSADPTFAAGCTYFGRATPTLIDGAVPEPGEIYYYLNRATTPYFGSLGADSSGTERTAVCAPE